MNMKLKILAFVALFTLGACAPIDLILQSQGSDKYEYVGCHIVEEDVDENGSVAFSFFGFVTPVVYFQQVGKDGTVYQGLRKPC